MLRIVSKADTADGFIQIFSHLCDRESLFIVTRAPKAIGTETRFSINLKTGEPIISGQGQVTERYESPENPYGRPGMKLRFIEIDGRSREFIEKLVAVREGRMARVRAASQVGGGDGEVPGQKSDLGTAETVKQAALAPPKEERAPGSDFILPANPFGELTDNVLEAFVECSLYEDTSAVPIESADGLTARGSSPSSILPSSPGIAMPPPVPMMSSGRVVMPPYDTSQAVPGVMPGLALAATQPASAAHVADAMRMAAPVAAPRAAVHDPAMMDTLLVSRRGSWRSVVVPAVVAAVLAAVVSLGVGYMLWGRDSGAGKVMAEAGELAEGEASAARAGAAEKTTEGEASAAKAGAVEKTTEGAAEAKIDEPAVKPAAGDEVQPGAAAQAVPPGDCQARITSDPSEASVFVGDRELGVTPLDTALPCGQVELRLTRARRDPTITTVTLAAGQANEVAVELERPRVELSVSSTPAGAEVKINGKSVGTTPVKLQVPGYRRAEVEVAKEGYKPYTTQVYPKDPSNSVRAKLSPERKKRR